MRRVADRVTRTKGVMGGVPVVAGTRVPTSSVYNFRQAGYSDDRILRDCFPHISHADIAAAVRYESRLDRRIIRWLDDILFSERES